MKIAWLTDIHLEFPEADVLDRFFTKLEKVAAQAVLISGDIGQAPTVIKYLRELQVAVKCPVYFVFGNHDYCYGTISSVREQASRAYSTGPIRWLSVSGTIQLTKKYCCIGHDGWGDGRNGDYVGSRVQLNDFNLIGELTGLSDEIRKRRITALGDEAADHIRKVLPSAIENFQHIIVVTHVPPFQESAIWMGKPSAPDWQPFFSCKAMGDVLVDFMQKNSDKQMTVLCGHTHGNGNVKILPNLVVCTGGARYGHPEIQKVFEVE